MSAEAAVALCAEWVAAGDPDRFAATMASPAAHRPGLFALYAANLELARAPWGRAEPFVAQMRLQWWAEALETLAEQGQALPHDIGPALATLPKAALLALSGVAQARQADCWSDPFETQAQLWAYLGATSGQVYLAAGAVMGAAHPALAEFGQAAGMAAWLVAQPELRRRGRLCLAGGAERQFAALAAEGQGRLQAAAQALAAAPRAARLAALPGWQAARIFQNAAHQPARVAAGQLRGSEFSRRASLLRARWAL